MTYLNDDFTGGKTTFYDMNRFIFIFSHRTRLGKEGFRVYLLPSNISRVFKSKGVCMCFNFLPSWVEIYCLPTVWQCLKNERVHRVFAFKIYLFNRQHVTFKLCINVDHGNDHLVEVVYILSRVPLDKVNELVFHDVPPPHR